MFHMFHAIQRKVKTLDVIERAHIEADSAEKDFFSLFFYHNNCKVRGGGGGGGGVKFAICWAAAHSYCRPDW